jgi:hypothetical protein
MQYTITDAALFHGFDKPYYAAMATAAAFMKGMAPGTRADELVDSMIREGIADKGREYWGKLIPAERIASAEVAIGALERAGLESLTRVTYKTIPFDKVRSALNGTVKALRAYDNEQSVRAAVSVKRVTYPKLPSTLKFVGAELQCSEWVEPTYVEGHPLNMLANGGSRLLGAYLGVQMSSDATVKMRDALELIASDQYFYGQMTLEQLVKLIQHPDVFSGVGVLANVLMARGVSPEISKSVESMLASGAAGISSFVAATNLTTEETVMAYVSIDAAMSQVEVAGLPVQIGKALSSQASAYATFLYFLSKAAFGRYMYPKMVVKASRETQQRWVSVALNLESLRRRRIAIGLIGGD